MRPRAPSMSPEPEYAVYRGVDHVPERDSLQPSSPAESTQSTQRWPDWTFTCTFSGPLCEAVAIVRPGHGSGDSAPSHEM